MLHGELSSYIQVCRLWLQGLCLRPREMVDAWIIREGMDEKFGTVLETSGLLLARKQRKR